MNEYHQKPIVSLCMIVRDSSATLADCLSNAKPWVDEIHILDTGSKDDTVEIAKSFGASVRHFEWCDDFSAARNESMRLARGRWILWLDSDEIIDAANGQALRRLAEQESNELIMGYQFSVISNNLIDHHIKLIRNGILFSRRVHESPIDHIKKSGGKCIHGGINLAHSGYDSNEIASIKSARNLRLARMMEIDNPENTHAHFSIARASFCLGRLDDAICYSRMLIANSESTLSRFHRRVAYTTLIDSLVMRERYTEAENVAQTGLREYPDSPDMLRARGLLAFCRSDLHSASTDFIQVLANQPNKTDREIALNCLAAIRATTTLSV